MKKPITKVVKSREELYVEFTDEEMVELGLKTGDKFSVSLEADGSIILTKFVPTEVEISALDHKTLVAIVEKSIKDQVPADTVITEILEGFLGLKETLGQGFMQ